MGLIRILSDFWRADLSPKIKYAFYAWHLLKSQIFYRYMLKSCGKNVLIQSPLSWSPENISVGNNVRIGEGGRIECIAKYGTQVFVPEIIIEDDVTFQQWCHVTAAGSLRIGKGRFWLCIKSTAATGTTS